MSALAQEIAAARRRSPGPVADLADATALALGAAAGELERLAVLLAAGAEPDAVRAGALRAAALALDAERAARAGRLALVAAISDDPSPLV